MSSFSSALIDALGGTSETARLMEAPISTVHRMRSDATTSRLNHLLRVVRMELPTLDVDALGREHGVELPDIGSGSEGGVADHENLDTGEMSAPSPGNVAEVSGAELSA